MENQTINMTERIDKILEWLCKNGCYSCYSTFSWIASDLNQDDLNELINKCNNEINDLYNMTLHDLSGYDDVTSLINKIALIIGTQARATDCTH